MTHPSHPPHPPRPPIPHCPDDATPSASIDFLVPFLLIIEIIYKKQQKAVKLS